MKEVYKEALTLALRKKRTKKQVVTKLIEKGFDAVSAEEAANYYQEIGYIDHRDYARRYTHDAVKIKGFGKLRIKIELQAKGIEDDIIDEFIEEAVFDIEGLMKKRFPSCLDRKEMQKIINYYFRRGFTTDEIRKATKNLYSVEGDLYD